MTTPDKLFKLDPVETKTTAPTTNFQVLAAAADQSVANRSINRGLAAFSTALGGLAEFKKKEQIRDDIKLAKDAAVRGEVMPNVFPIAEKAYKDIVDLNTAADSLASIERWENGSELDLVINDHSMSSSDKTAGLEATYDTYYAEAVQHGMNPDTAQKLRLAINVKKEQSYQKVYEQEKNLRTIQGIHGVSNTLKDAKRFAESTNIPLTDTLTSDWIKNNAKDLGVSHPYLNESERKLIVFQVLTSDEDVLGDADIIENIMKSEYSKGFTYKNLLFGKGQDSEEMLKIYKAYVENSKAYFEDLEDKQKASDLANKNQVLDSVRENWIGAGKTSAEGISASMLTSGQFTEAQANKKQKDVQKFMDNNIKFQRGSEEYQEALGMIQSQSVTLPSEVDDLIITGQLNPELGTVLKGYLTEEGNQKLKFIADYQNTIKDLSKNVLSLSKIQLKNKNIFTFEGREPTRAEMIQVLSGTGLDPEQVKLIIREVQNLHNGMRAQAEKMGIADSIADKADGSVPEENLAKFQKMMENNIDKLVADIDKGLKEIPEEETFTNLETPSSIASEYPLVVRPRNDIFSKDFKPSSIESPTADSEPNISEIDLSYTQDGNMNLKSYILDAARGLGDDVWLKKVITEEQVKQQKLLEQIKNQPKEKKRGKVYEAASPTEKIKIDLRMETRRQENQALSDWLGERVDVMKSVPGLLLDEWRGEGIAFKKEPKVSKEIAIARSKARLRRIDDKFDELFSVQGLVEIAKDLVGKGDIPDPFELGEATGRITTEGRPEFKNNQGTTSTEYSIGVKDSRINDGQMTHIPSIYDGKVVSEEEAILRVVEAGGKDSETDRHLPPETVLGGDPEERSRAITFKDKEEQKEPDKVSSVEPELSTIQKVASAVNTVVGTGTSTVEARETPKTFEQLPKEIQKLPEIQKYVTPEIAAKSIKRNNPFNVEKGESWQGLVKSDSNRFFATDTPLNGLRAGYINVLAKLKRGLTLSQTIEKLSPRSDNNPTPAMIKVASKMSGIGEGEKLEVSMKNFEAIKQLGLGLLKFEAPGHTYPDSMINEAVKLAIEQKTNIKSKQIVKGKEFYPPPKSDFKVKKIKPIVEKGSIFKSLSEMPRKVFNEVVPDNLRFFASYLKDNKILSPNTKNPVVTEKALSSGVQSVLMTAVKKAIASGRTNVDYADYPNTSFGMSVPAMVSAKGRSKEEYKEAKDRYPKGWLGKARLLLDSSDDVVAAATTIGGFNFKIIKGDVVITDIYDFSKYGGAKDSAYAEVRKDVHTKKGNVVYQIRANLGKLKKDIKV